MQINQALPTLPALYLQVVFERREEDTAKTRLRAELDRLRRKVEEEQMTAAVRAKQAADAVAAATAANTPANAQVGVRRWLLNAENVV